MSMELVSRLFVASMAFAVALAGCGHKQEPVAAPDCRSSGRDIECKPLDCGGNSRVVNTFPVNGFTKDGRGACNIAGVQLLPQSLHGGGCGSGADLGLDPTGTRLIGTRRGEVVCSGKRLAGATFTVRSFAKAKISFTIAKVREIQGLHGKTYEGYRIESGGASACEPGVAQRVRRQLGLVAEEPAPRRAVPVAALPTPAGYQHGPNDDLVIAVDGPLYDGRDQLIDDSRAHWFNLACAGDALAKRTLYELYLAGNDARNDTALRMLTANYCGKPYTVPGVEFGWLRDDMRPKLLEARWYAGKAACIDIPRLMMLQVTEGEPYNPALLPAQLQPKGCDKGENCDANGWITALRAECQLPSCDATERKFEFESYVFDDAKTLFSTTANEP
jgi:hypothetical protein